MPLTISLTAGEEIDLTSNSVAYTKQSLLLIHILLLTCIDIVGIHGHIVTSATVILVEQCIAREVREAIRSGRSEIWARPDG